MMAHPYFRCLSSTGGHHSEGVDVHETNFVNDSFLFGLTYDVKVAQRIPLNTGVYRHG